MIRHATAKDIPYILELYEAGLRALGETDIKESLLLKKIINSFHLAPCFLLIVDDRIRGMAGFTVLTTSHNGVASMVDYMFYVDPEHRSPNNLHALTTAAKDFARDKNMPIKVEYLVLNDFKLKERLLRMHGFRVHSIAGIFDPKGES